MGAPRSIDDLCRKYHNEDCHTNHVTRLALQLFDETRRHLKLPPADRAILAAAGRLHDVAYSVDSRRHREQSAVIIQRELRDRNRALIAATLLCHAGDWTALRPPVPDRARRLGALLRIADGLDFGHLQDTTITGVRSRGGKIRVTVRAPLFPHNLQRADEKADLWRAVFSLDIEFVAARSDSSKAALLGPDLSIPEAARRLITQQFKIVGVNLAGALAGDIKALHDIRVGLRRLRVALRVFRKPLTTTSAGEIEEAVARVNAQLGPVRDLDVWVHFLTSPAVQRDLAGNRRWAAFVRHQQASRRLQQPTLNRHLTGASFGALRLKIGRLVRLELPQLHQQTTPGSLVKLARRSLGKSLARALTQGKPRPADSPQELHERRIALRKARYRGEFFSPVLGPVIAKLTRRIRAAEQALARVHDTDVGLMQIATHGPPPPRLLLAKLAARRATDRETASREWRRLEEFLSNRKIRRKLKLERI